jgi:hypothetical protein
MNKIPVNYVIMTSTKGHFGLSTHEETVNHLNSQLPLGLFAQKIVHIKVSDDTKEKEVGMIDFFAKHNFNIKTSYTHQWRHNDGSHQQGYLSDLTKVFGLADTQDVPYTLITEDDFLLSTSNGEPLEYFITKGVKILQSDPNIVQIRIPRFNNEFDRINGLKIKHNLDWRADKYWNDDYSKDVFACSDWSNNVYLCRTRDLNIATMLIEKFPSTFGQHSEHSTAAAMRLLSRVELPFCVFWPDKIRCFHIGAEPQNRDVVGQELNSN